MHATNHLSEMQRHRAMLAGEYLGEVILALSRWVSRVAQGLHVPGVAAREQAHTPR